MTAPIDWDIIACCARVNLSHPAAAQLGAAIKHPAIDWGHVAALAVLHGVSPLVLRTLDRHQLMIPHQAYACLLHDRDRIIRRNNLVVENMALVLAALLREGIRVLPFKGAILATQVYGDLYLKRYCDLDLLVSGHDYSHAQSVFLRSGYTMKSEYFWQSSWKHSDIPLVLDLHCSISPPRFPVRMQFEPVWRRRQPLEIAGEVIHVLSPTDMYFVLCTQLVRNAWEHNLILSKICDLHELSLRGHAVDWSTLRETSRSLHAERIVAISEEVVRQLFGDGPPNNRLCIDSPTVSSTAKHMVDEMCNPGSTLLSRYSEERIHWIVRERWPDRMWPYLHRVLLSIFRNARLRRSIRKWMGIVSPRMTNPYS